MQETVRLGDGLIEVQHLPVELCPANSKSGSTMTATNMRTAQRQMKEAALAPNQGNRRQAARELAINPSTLYRRLKAMAAADVEGHW